MTKISDIKTVLVLASHPGLAEAIRSSLDGARYRIVHRLNGNQAEPLLEHALVQVCVIDSEVAETEGIWLFEKIQRRLPGIPMIVYCEEGKWALEEESYLAGVRHVLRKPVRPRLLEAVFSQTPAPIPVRSSATPRPLAPAKFTESAPRPGKEVTLRALQRWREFSGLLGHSLSTESLLKHFLLQLRELTGVNRAAIFLRQPESALGDRPPPGTGRLLCSASALGLSSGVLDDLELSIDTGIGEYLFHQGRILWRDSDATERDPEIEREFSLLGVQVVVPILDRQSLIGFAGFDGRVTGEPLSNEELEIIFHVLEAVGLAIRNIWFHDQLEANQRMLTDVLRQFSSGCLVVGRDLSILHCNDTARRFLVGSRRETELQFTDLPVVLGSKVYQVLKSGAALAPFRFQPENSGKSVYQISIVPLQSRAVALPDSAMMVIEDRTQTEQLNQLEIETANLRLIRSMADRLAHEIGNALVPVSTHQQLIADQYLDPDFRASLDVALSDGVKRISRLVSQMRFLARDNVAAEESFPLVPLVEEAFREAQVHQPVKSALLKFEDGTQPAMIFGDRPALKHAFLEVFLNALQANPKDPKIAVRLLPDQGFNGKGRRWTQVEVQDNGSGFSAEALARVPSPFYTTRTVGLGLGLSVTRKIIETHHGKLEILNPADGRHGMVRIFLPQSAN